MAQTATASNAAIPSSAFRYTGPAKLGIAGTRLTLDGNPFAFQGLSFFNAVFCPPFISSEATRTRWLATFRGYGINALRIWCNWANRGFVDSGPDTRVRGLDGSVRPEQFAKLEALLKSAAAHGMVVEVVCFSSQDRPGRLDPIPLPAMERFVRELTTLLRPHPNVLLQIWNETSFETPRLVSVARNADATRLVTSCHGPHNVFGNDAENEILDILTPHTARENVPPLGPFWETAPRQIATLMAKFNKPVLDDEPARSGLLAGGGTPGGTNAWQHIAQIDAVRRAGSYSIFHHDMFQAGPADPAVPPSGIPEPEYSPVHRPVFEYLRDHPNWKTNAELAAATKS